MPENSDTTMNRTVFGVSLKDIADGLSGYFDGLDARAKPLPAYTATIMERCGIASLALWLAFQGAYLYNSAIMPSIWWFTAFMLSSIATFVFSDRLSLNMPRASVGMQFGSILLIGLSLVQGGQLGLLSSSYLWLMPALTLLLALYLAVRRNLEPFAFAGYAIALIVPMFAGIPENSPTLFFGYYFVLCLPLPLITIFRHWKYLNLCVFAWLFAASGYYMPTLYSIAGFDNAQFFLGLFFAWYLLVLWVRIAKAPFSVMNFLDFFFGVGVATGWVICQLRIAALSEDGVMCAVMGMALVFLAVSVLGRLTWGERGKTLSRIYLFIAVVLLDSSVALIWPGETALGVYCLQAVLLFWLGSAASVMRIKAGGFIILMLAPVYFFMVPQQALAGSMFMAVSCLLFAYIQDRELKRLARRSGRKPWSSRLELFLVAYGFIWCFGGLAVFTFRDMPSPGLIYFALSSACAYVFFSLGKLFRLRSLRVAIFLPMLIAIPAVLLPFVYQTYIEWPETEHLLSYNYLTGIGALAWVSYFITVWTGLYHNWGGLISNRNHARFLALVTLELVLVLTSSIRAFALEFGVSPSVLSVLATLPSLLCIYVISRAMKFRRVERPYRTPMLLVVPWLLFFALGLWFISALSIPGSAAPGGKYVPLLNPIEMGQLVIMLFFAYWQRRLRKSAIPTAHLSTGVRLWIYGVGAFLCLHGVMFRVVQYFSQAQAQEVFDFVELRIIFACIWVVYGILVWIGSTMFASTFSWLTGVILLGAGAFTLISLAAGLWGQFVAVVMGISTLVVLTLLVWRSPAPFTQRGRKAAEQAY